MARERWFLARNNRRMGPFPRRQLVESLLATPDPRACLIWRHGLTAWTPAREVPEIDQRLAPLFPVKDPRPSPPVQEPAGSRASPDSMRALEARAPTRVEVPAAKARFPGSRLLVYGGGAAAVLVLALLAWRFLPGRSPGTSKSVAPGSAAGAATPSGSPTASDSPTVAEPGGGPAPVRAPAFAGWSDQEADLPPPELKQLRGVAAWSGEQLTITLYNASVWRVTEILVRTSRLEKDHVVDADAPHRLLPGAGAPVDAAVGELLEKVAPERKKPGVNPLDTGSFQAKVGPQPEAYRWRIEGARGYPPRAGS